jgi:hypothetical protein
MWRHSLIAEIYWTAAICVALTSCAAPSSEVASSASTNSQGVAGEGFIGPDGRCATDLRPQGLPSNALGFQAGPEVSRNSHAEAWAPRLAPGLQSNRNITLGMTECDLIGVAGPTEMFEQSSTGGDRVVVLTYVHGQHPGIYRFVSGKLRIIERLPDQSKPSPKPLRQKKS